MEIEQFSTGAKRNSASGKGAFELLPAKCIRLLAEHYEKGAEAHGGRNWEKGIPLQRIFQSALRHSFDFLEGKTEEDHALSALWNWSVLIETRERIKAGLLPNELNDFKNIPLWKNSQNISTAAKSKEEIQKVVNKLRTTQDNHLLIPILSKSCVKDFSQWIKSKEFRPALLNYAFHPQAFQIEFKSTHRKGRCYSTDFKKGVFEPRLWRYIEIEHTDGSFKSTYPLKQISSKINWFNSSQLIDDGNGGKRWMTEEEFLYPMRYTTGLIIGKDEMGNFVRVRSDGKAIKYDESNQDEYNFEAEQARLARIDQEIEDKQTSTRQYNPEEINRAVDSYNKKFAYDELKGLNLNTLKNHPIWKIISPILTSDKNIQELVWHDFSVIPKPNQELLLQYNTQQLQRFSPNFPVAKYCLGYANTLDKSLYIKWAYLSKEWTQDQEREDKRLEKELGIPTPSIAENLGKLSIDQKSKEALDLKQLAAPIQPNKHVLPPKKEIGAVNDHFRWRETTKETPISDDLFPGQFDIQVSYDKGLNHVKNIKYYEINVLNEYCWWRYIE